MNELGNTTADKNYKPSGTTKAQEAALKAFPGQPFIHDRCVFRMGYEQAEKDTIDRACKWIEENVVIYPHLDNKPLCIVNLDTFRKAMEEEQ